jgi:hypothetical protein
VVRLRVNYGYDGLNRRVFDKVDQFSARGILLSSVTTRHVFDGSQVYADVSNGIITTRYLLGDAMGKRFARRAISCCKIGWAACARC